MKKTILAIFLLFSIIGYAYAQTVAQTILQKEKLRYSTIEEKRKELWKDFHIIRFEKFSEFQEINLYAENDSLTRICFICDKGLFIFYWNKSEGHIKKIQHAKMIMYDSINRITFGHKEKKDLGFFKLWHYETEELSINIH